MSDYYAVIATEVRGPFTPESMRAFEQSGEIEGSTAVLEVGTEQWKFWRDVPSSAPSPTRTERGVARPRRRLREIQDGYGHDATPARPSRYPILRWICKAFIVLDIVAAFILCADGVQNQEVGYYFAAFGCGVGILFFLFGLLLIDIADAVLGRGN